MRVRHSDTFLILALYLSPPVSAQGLSQPTAARTGASSGGAVARVPSGVILVKGAWSSASDSETPVPEGGTVAGNVFKDSYFAITYNVPADWIKKYQGPPPSDSGRYVLAELSPASTFKGPRGSILVTAQDLFFTQPPASNSAELINYRKDNLQADYKVEVAPRPIKIAEHDFLFFAYWSPVAQLHWYILTTQIRCHAVEIVLTSRDTKLLEALTSDLNKMILPAEASPMAGTGGGSAPVCIKDYANDQNLVSRVNPIFTEHRHNPVPVRITIDKDGKVKHIHYLSAFVDQARAITDALGQWKFKPYMKDGRPIEVETGILFGPRSTQ